MSQTYIAAIVGLITVLAPVFGVHITDNEGLNNAITGITNGALFLWVLVRRLQVGDIHISGIRKS